LCLRSVEQFESEIASLKSGNVDVDAWALESHQIAEDVAYRKLPGGGPEPEQPADPPVTACPSPPGPTFKLDAGYRNAAQTTIPEQLARGGARLALLLNSVWP
jgi:hypothetical protein